MAVFSVVMGQVIFWENFSWYRYEMCRFRERFLSLSLSPRVLLVHYVWRIVKIWKKHFSFFAKVYRYEQIFRKPHGKFYFEFKFVKQLKTRFETYFYKNVYRNSDKLRLLSKKRKTLIRSFISDQLQYLYSVRPCWRNIYRFQLIRCRDFCMLWIDNTSVVM